MNMKQICFSLSIIALLFLYACQKDFTVKDNDSVGQALAVDSNYIDKIYGLWDNGTGIDTQQILTFKYDATKRLASVHDSDITMSGMIHWSSDYYFYNGADSIPFKYIQVSTETSTDLDSSTTFYFYNPLYRKTKDSILVASYISGICDYKTFNVDNYNYVSGYRYTSSSGYKNIILPPPYIYTFTGKDTGMIDSYGNMTAFDIHLQIVSPITSGSSSYSSKSIFTFDNKPNPFAKLSIFSALKNGGGAKFLDLIVSTNNITRTETISPPFTYLTLYSYIYNSTGYPVICNTSDSIKYLFKYKIL